MFRFLQILSYIYIRIFHPTKVIGRKNLPKGRAVLICNHQNNYDVVIVGSYIWQKRYFLGKKELFNTKFKSWFFRSMGGIPVNRGAVDLSAIKSSISALNKNKYLVIFPEGTRNKTNEELQAFKNGAAMIAVKGKAPIVPMWIENKPGFLRFCKLHIGKPIDLTKYFDEKLSADVLNEISNIIQKQMLETKNN